MCCSFNEDGGAVKPERIILIFHTYVAMAVNPHFARCRVNQLSYKYPFGCPKAPPPHPAPQNPLIDGEEPVGDGVILRYSMKIFVDWLDILIVTALGGLRQSKG